VNPHAHVLARGIHRLDHGLRDLFDHGAFLVFGATFDHVNLYERHLVVSL
jgi:hypothetical protein